MLILGMEQRQQRRLVQRIWLVSQHVLHCRTDELNDAVRIGDGNEVGGFTHQRREAGFAFMLILLGA